MDWKQKSKKAISALLTTSLIGSGMVMGNTGSVVAAEKFDETNVVLRFGVLSDIHLSGLWNVEGSRQKLDRAYTGLELMAGENKLDAVFIDGDIVDAMNSSGNMSDSIPKLEQNYKEISAFRDISLNHFGGSDTKIIYANGNHDTADGVALDENKKTDTTGFWSSKLYQKILAGYMWSASVPGNASATAREIADYNKERIKNYDEKSGENYAFFYGSDEYLGANGLDYGNRHVVVGGYHFLTIEPKDYSVSYRDETVEWLDKTLAEITSAEPDKAVFVATHARVTNTIFGSLGQTTRQLVPTLNKYPQVILWGGHEHSALNRELAIWQDGFTAVDAGVVQYLNSADFGYYANSANPVNGVDYGGWGGTEYRKASQGEYVEVDGNGNVRIKRLDFYNSDLEGGEVKVIGKPWEILGTKADGSHLTRYTEKNRADGNTAPIFPSDAKLSVSQKENLATVTFPAASDDIRVISYFVTVEQNGKEYTKQELTSFYYDCADASVLNDRTYTANELKCPKGDSVIKVTAIDDYGATATLSADITVEGEVSYPSSEFDLKNLNKDGWSGSTNKGTLTHGMTFDGRTGVSVLTKSDDNKNSNDQIIMNYVNFGGIDRVSLEATPYMVIDYYYAHDTASAKSAATQMRWRFFIKAKNNKQVTKEAALETNRWATAVIPLTDADFAEDGYLLKQYKFDPYAAVPTKDLDDNDTMYISGIRFVHEEPTVFTENGVAYASSDGYIKGIGAKVATTIDGAIKNLGADGGKVLVEGDMIITDAADLEKAGTARKSVTVMGYGEDLAARQKNRLWFQKTGIGRDAAYNGDITYDEITLKAPIDEAGVFSQGVTVTFGKNLLTEKTVKANTDIDAMGDKSISVDFGAYCNQNGDSNFIINGGDFGRVATLFTWIQSNASAKINAHYIFRGGNFNVVYSGARNSTTGVLTNTGNVTYDFEGGTFNNVYTGHMGFGKVTGLIRYNVTGGTFPKGIIFGSEERSADKSQVGNTVVRIDGASVTLWGNDKLSKVNDTDKWIAIENHAENGKVTFGDSLTADYKIKVYGGEADAVFENGVLSGFTIASDGGYAPIVDGKILTAQNGVYDLSAYEGKTTEIYFNELPVDPEFSEEGAQNEKLTVRGAQIRITGEDYALRFVGILGSNLKDKLQKPASDKDTTLGYGFVVYPVELLGEIELSKETSGAVVVPAVKTFREEDDHIEFTVCVTGITTDKFNRYYAVRPYVTYTDSFGIERTVYGECYKNASLLSVAKMIPESDPSYSWVKENILDKAE